MIEFSNEDKEEFIKAIDELIKQVDDCILRNKRTKQGKISIEGSSSQNIKQYLEFIDKKYNYSFKIAIGNSGGFLNSDSWIMFARNDLLKEGLINGKKITPTKGVYIFIAYSGYLEDNKHIVLKFGFPQGNIENSRCVAINKMENDGYLKKFDFICDLSDKDKLLKDFLKMMNYFNSFSENDFRLNKNNKIIFKNQILYGPPGTGKTYHTIDKVLEILGENLENRIDKKAKFDEYVKNGQIVFTTFHQSYGYEEFIEGIKPIINKDNGNSKELDYEIKDGIFKRICNRALNKERKVDNNEIDDITINNDTPIWKISLGPNASLRDKCFKENKIYIGWNKIPENMNEEFLALGTNDKSTINNFKDEMQIGDLVCVFNSLKTIKGVGIIKSDVKYGDDKEEYRTYRDVEWISKDSEISLYELNDNKNLTLKTVYKLWRIRANDLLEKIKNEKEQIDIKTIDDNTEKKFVIIIDEINRGNVSKIFGELTTLIEPSKRISKEEELRVTLPYSGEKFGVPENVYIIGTMNTADRSITSLDTALRRRFEFVEMMPDLSKLSNKFVKKDQEKVELQQLLEAINTRIEYLLDREKTIGHAFFMNIENLNDLKWVFQNKIIPLLQEYFYDDYALINAVLNNNGMIEEVVENKENDYLHSIRKLEIYNEKIIYNITSFDSKIWDNEITYQKIYKNQISDNKTKEN
ncbi:AAA family ATPase [Campylobacter sp. LH-2024]|uniref:AAA family ATPase n=2 Tax=Campylobacter TaxID=194 RepID=UPI003AA985C8